MSQELPLGKHEFYPHEFIEVMSFSFESQFNGGGRGRKLKAHWIYRL